MSLQTYLRELGTGISMVAECKGMSEHDLAELGADPQTAEDMLHLYKVYFGQTAYTRKQRTARTAARGHTLVTLQVIEKYVGRIKHQVAAWDLRILLCNTVAARIPAVARKKIREIQPPKSPDPGVRITRRKDGNHTMSITDSSMAIADMAGQLKNHDKDPLQAIRDIFQGTAAGPAPQVRTNVVIRLDQLDRIINGDGEEIQLELTNGATMSGAELVQRTLSDIGLITLIHPYAGPVNLYNCERFASTKQREMLSAEHPTCAWPGCHAPAENCQFHHLDRYQDGGPTNPANMVPLCGYHNAANDDDPTKPTGKGRMARIDGRVAWLPPWAGPPRFSPSPAYPDDKRPDTSNKEKAPPDGDAST